MRNLMIGLIIALIAIQHNNAYSGPDLDFRPPAPPGGKEDESPDPEPPLIPTMCERLVTYRDKHTGQVIQELVPVPDIHVGDVHITASGDHIEYLCIRKIIGDLVLDDNYVRTIQWPRLQQVTGDLTITYDQYIDYNHAVAELTTIEVINLENLWRVGGSLTLRSPDNDTPQNNAILFDFGLPQLRSIGENFNIIIDCFNYDLKGLTALTGIEGDLYFDGCSGDGTNLSFLKNFTWVGGNADIILGWSTQKSMFDALEYVDGNLTISSGLFVDPSFSQLKQVLGKLTLNDLKFSYYYDSFLFLPNLEFTGYLYWRGGTADTDIVVGNSAWTSGGLTLTQLGWLNDLDMLMSHAELSETASVRITDNPNISDCEARDWVNSLPDYKGKVDIHRNGPC